MTATDVLEFAPPSLPLALLPADVDIAALDLLPQQDAERPLPLDAIVISDIHLGSDNCQAKTLAPLLETILDGQLRTRRLIINGDVFDSIDFRRLKKTHWRILSLIRHLSDKIDVIWICGNHDGSAEIISQLLGVEVVEQFIFKSGEAKILAVHGHEFDDFIDNHPVVTWLADCVYLFLQKIDRSHRVARLAKSRSKVFVRCVEKIERGAISLARRNECQIAICGHTHHATHTSAGDVHYFNSGCFTEKPATYLSIQHGRVRIEKCELVESPAMA